MNALEEPEIILRGSAPIVRQIQEQIRACILSGQLQAGEQLPSVRAVAVGLAVNPYAVHQAYAELECQGLVTTEDGSGTLVAATPGIPGAPEEQPTALERFCHQCLAHARAMGFVAEDVLRGIERLAQRRTPS